MSTYKMETSLSSSSKTQTAASDEVSSPRASPVVVSLDSNSLTVSASSCASVYPRGTKSSQISASSLAPVPNTSQASAPSQISQTSASSQASEPSASTSRGNSYIVAQGKKACPPIYLKSTGYWTSTMNLIRENNTSIK